MDVLRRWWAKKYRLPWSHELCQDSTLSELLVEFYEDYYVDNPLEVHRNPDGQIQFKDTGDKMIDKWEAELAEGKIPDYMEAFDQAQLEKLDRLRTRGKTHFGHKRRTIAETVSAVARRTDGRGLNKQEEPATFPRRFKDEP